MFNEDGTFTTSSETAPEWYNYTGYWYFNTIDNFQGNYTYYYDIETVMDIEESDNAEAAVENVDVSELADDAVNALTNAEEEPMTYREDYAIRLYIKDELCTLELESLFVSGSMTNAESLTIVEEANAALVGHWNASTATEFNTDNEGSREASVDFYLDISEDGSFIGYAGQEIQGYVEFYDIEDGDSRYLAHFSAGPYAEGMFILHGDTLMANIRPYLVNFVR